MTLLEPDPRPVGEDRDAVDNGGADRGDTTLATVVFERIAARAASEVEGVEDVVRTGLWRFVPGASPVGADAEVDAGSVAVDLSVRVVYPLPARKLAERVREHVIERLDALTGFRVTEVNITIPEFAAPHPRRRRKG